MESKLRRWLESRCWKRPDGTWLVRPVAFLRPPQPVCVLPGDPEKEVYLTQAVVLGRLRLIQYSSAWNALLALTVWNSARKVISVNYPVLFWAPLIVAIVALSMLLWTTNRAEKRLCAWLHEVGQGAAPDGGLSAEEREPRWLLGASYGFMRCRPGWMVAEDAAVVCGLAVLIHWGFVLYFGSGERPGCRKLLNGWRTGTASFPDGFVCVVSGFTLLALLAFAACLVLQTWDWWRWNKRRAEPPTCPT